MDSLLSVVSLMLQALAEKQDAPQSAAATQWTEADFNSVAAAVGSKSSSAADVLNAVSAQLADAIKDELSSAVCVLLLDLGKILGVEVQELVQPRYTSFLTVSSVLKEGAAKLAATADAATQLTSKLSASESALESARIVLEQRDAALTAASTEFKKEIAASTESTALLSKKLCSVFEMLKKALPDECTAHSTWHYLATALIQQNHDISEPEGDVLKQVEAMEGSVSKLCNAYKEVATPAVSASKVNAIPTGVVEQWPELQGALAKLKYESEPLLLRERELTAVHRVVTEAIAANTSACVHVHGPTGSGKFTSLLHHFDSPVEEWCKQHSKREPISVSIDCSIGFNPVGLHGEILEELEHEDISRIAAEAKKQLEAVVCNNTNRDLPMIVLKLHHLHRLLPKHTDQLEQLFKMTAGSRLILGTDGQADVSLLYPGLQQHSVVPAQVLFAPYAESEIVAILSARCGSAVQPAALKLCAKHASGNAVRALKTCILAVELAVSDCDCSGEVTLRHMRQAVHFVARASGIYGASGVLRLLDL
eukprot:16593-Heterococcus_DN1.PRE.2